MLIRVPFASEVKLMKYWNKNLERTILVLMETFENGEESTEIDIADLDHEVSMILMDYLEDLGYEVDLYPDQGLMNIKA